MTKHLPSGEQMPIYDAAMRYKKEGVPLVIFGGKEYGTGSSRDWAAKGTLLLGVKAVIVESFERIHRSNLVGMGVLPLTFKEGMDRKSLGITGEEIIDVTGLHDIKPRMDLTLVIHRPNGKVDQRAGDLPHRYDRRGRLLPARRHPAVRAARDGEGRVGGRTDAGPVRVGSAPHFTTKQAENHDGPRKPIKLNDQPAPPIDQTYGVEVENWSDADTAHAE